MRSPDFRPPTPSEHRVTEVSKFGLDQLPANPNIICVTFSTDSGNGYALMRHPENGEWFLANKNATKANSGKLSGQPLAPEDLRLQLRVGESFQYHGGGATTPVQSIRVYEKLPAAQGAPREVGQPKKVETPQLSQDVIVTPEAGIADPVIIGDLSTNGFMILESNHKSGQDAFAVDRKRKRFVVCDGMGSYSKSGAVARGLSKAIAESPLTFAELFPPTARTVGEVTGPLKAILAQIKDMAEYRQANEDGKAGNSGQTTLTIAEKQADGSWLYVVIGDSPLYADDAQGGWQGVGNDTIGEQSTGISLGINNDQVSIDFGAKAQGFKRGQIPARDGMRLVLGSDWLSDNLESQSREFAERQIAKIQQEIADMRANRYFMYNNGGSQRPEKIEITDDAHLAQLVRTREGWIRQYQDQLSRRQPFNPFLLQDVRDPRQLSEIAQGKQRVAVRKPDDLTIILIDSDKI